MSTDVDATDELVVSVMGGVATVTMNRPASLNAISNVMVASMARVFTELGSDPEVRVVVLTGAGRAFCAGGDVKAMNTSETRPAAVVRDGLVRNAPALLRSITELEKPVVAVVSGPAYGAGFSLALACDFILARSSSTFCASFVRRGLVPDYGASYLLTSAVGARIAKDLLMRAVVVEAERGRALGFVNEVWGDDFDARVEEWVHELAIGPTRALGLTKRLVAAAERSDLVAAVEREAIAQGQSVQSSDHREGLAAFLDRRTASFTGQ